LGYVVPHPERNPREYETTVTLCSHCHQYEM
jgi:hypothetical protein